MNHFQYTGGGPYGATKAGADPRKVVYSGVGKVELASFLKAHIKNP